MQSNKFSLNKADLETWSSNVLVFLAPLGVIYFGAIVAALQTPNHVFTATDLVPSNFTLGAMVLYVVNAVYDLCRKFVKGQQ